jgi:hypothetical protein
VPKGRLRTALQDQPLREFEPRKSPRALAVLRFTWWNFLAPVVRARTKNRWRTSNRCVKIDKVSAEKALHSLNPKGIEATKGLRWMYPSLVCFLPE